MGMIWRWRWHVQWPGQRHGSTFQFGDVQICRETRWFLYLQIDNGMIVAISIRSHACVFAPIGQRGLNDGQFGRDALVHDSIFHLITNVVRWINAIAFHLPGDIQWLIAIGFASDCDAIAATNWNLFLMSAHLWADCTNERNCKMRSLFISVNSHSPCTVSRINLLRPAPISFLAWHKKYPSCDWLTFWMISVPFG